jgi:hypothetical protein
VNVGSGRVESHLHRQGAAGELAEKVFLVDQVDGSAAQSLELGGRRAHGGRELYVPGRAVKAS